ncbi:hypothetical protein GCM10009560_20850 [Nonomuraea longicatena]|uniref:Thioredoxin-like fold domain-containing protein n=1 Tax=Nonomuraea longicatena TaxID=83682 RepID=A0ABN1P2V6_9ACTN
MAAIVVACMVIGVFGAIAVAGTGGTTQGSYQVTRQPDGSMMLAAPGTSAPVLQVYEDYDCPVCKRLHDTVDATLLRLAKEGRVRVVYHPVTIFQDEPMRSNSVRAAAAARCVPPANWLAFRDALYAIQPEPHGTATGFTDAELIAAARKAGASVDACVTDQTYVKQHLAENVGSRLQGTPTVLFNGQMLGDEVFDAEALEKLVTGGTGIAV